MSGLLRRLRRFPEVEMEQLQELLSRLTNLSSLEIRQLRFRFPQKSLIQAIRQTKGEETGEKFLQLIAKACDVRIVPGENLQFDQQLVSTLGAELARLGASLKAAPITLSNTEPGETIILAMTDPTDESTRRIFETLLQKPVQPVLVREEELVEALRFALPASTRSGRFTRVPLKASSEPAHIFEGLKTIVEKVIACGGRELRFDILNTGISNCLKMSFDQETTVDSDLSADELLTGILARGAYTRAADGTLTGRAHLTTNPAGIDFDFTYSPDFKSKSGEKGRMVTLSNFTVRSEFDPIFWNSPATASSEQFATVFKQHPGLYIGAFPNLEHQHGALAALQRLCADMYVLQDIQELSTDPEMGRRLTYSRVVLPLKSQGPEHVLRLLEKAPQGLRDVIRGIFGYAEFERPCGMCVEELTQPSSLALLPEQVRSRAQKVHYSRGCPLCAKTGFAGVTTIVSFANLNDAAGRAFKVGTPTAEIVPTLRSEGWTSLAEIAFEQLLNGTVTVEQVSALFFGQSPQSLRVRAGELNSALSPLTESPLLRNDAVPQKQVDFHSVVLAAGGELLAAREALLNEAKGMFETHAAPAAAEAKPKSDHPFHSVVLNLDDDMAAMRAKLLAESEED